MSSTGYVFPSVAANVDDGSSPWSNVNNVFADDNTYASTPENPGTTSDRIRSTGYGFSIPSGATGLSATIRVRRYRDASSQTISVWHLQLVNNGSGIGSGVSVGFDWPTSEGVYTSSSISSGLSVDVINSETFGAQLNVTWTAGIPGIEVYAYVESIEISITYTDPVTSKIVSQTRVANSVGT